MCMRVAGILASWPRCGHGEGIDKSLAAARKLLLPALLSHAVGKTSQAQWKAAVSLRFELPGRSVVMVCVRTQQQPVRGSLGERLHLLTCTSIGFGCAVDERTLESYVICWQLCVCRLVDYLFKRDSQFHLANRMAWPTTIIRYCGRTFFVSVYVCESSRWFSHKWFGLPRVYCQTTS